MNLHRDRNIWLGRLHNLNVKNQMLLVYGFAHRNLPNAPGVMNYTTPNLTTNHIDANGNLILPGSHNQTSTSPAANNTNQSASINRNSTNSSSLGGDPAPLPPNAIPLEPNRTIINTTTNRTKPLYTGNSSSGGNRVLQSLPSREQLLPEERFIIEYRLRIRGKDDNKETWREVTRGFDRPGQAGNSIAEIECRRVGTK